MLLPSCSLDLSAFFFEAASLSVQASLHFQFSHPRLLLSLRGCQTLRFTLGSLALLHEKARSFLAPAVLFQACQTLSF